MDFTLDHDAYPPVRLADWRFMRRSFPWAWVLLLASCSAVGDRGLAANSAPYSLRDTFERDMPAETVGGVAFPRTGYGFRGQETFLYGLERALAAFRDDDKGLLESPLFAGLKLSLMKRLSPAAGPRVAALRERLCRNWADIAAVYDAGTTASRRCSRTRR